jgi:hypothetical protein
MDLYSELEWRGLVYDATEGTREQMARAPVIGYIGFDPTASSLHVGSLLVIMALARVQRAGHSPIALVGGGTGLIGDPKPTLERALLTPEQVEQNVTGIRGQLERFLDFSPGPHAARLVNNAEWLTRLSAIEFMRDVGKHFSMNAMIARDAVKKRMEGEGISYTEFSYALCTAVPLPDPNLDMAGAEADLAAGLSQRQVLERHRADTACAGCHSLMDPIGLGLENYDAIGAYRTMDGTNAIDAGGELPTGELFTGPKELAALLAADPNFARCLTEKLYTYALGRAPDRAPEHLDGPMLVALATRLSEAGYSFSELVAGIVTSPTFLNRRGDPATGM